MDKTPLKSERVNCHGKDVRVDSFCGEDSVSGLTVIDFEAQCDGKTVRSRMTVAGAEDHALDPAYDVAQLRKDIAAETVRLSGIAESRARASKLTDQLASEAAAASGAEPKP